MLIDTHLHLDAAAFDPDRQAVIDRARAAGVARFVIPAVHAGNFAQVQHLSASLSGSAFALGIHPLYVQQASADDIERLESQLAQGLACAVGEIGLDGFVPEADPALQERYFTAQIKLAKKFDLPVILHTRHALDRVLKVLRQHKLRGGLSHAFNGSVQQAEQLIALGFKLGFGGAMSYSGSLRIRKLAAHLPLHALVLESDAPDIPPAWAPRERNEPANVARFAQELANLRGASLEQIVQATTRNAIEALGLSE